MSRNKNRNRRAAFDLLGNVKVVQACRLLFVHGLVTNQLLALGRAVRAVGTRVRPREVVGRRVKSFGVLVDRRLLRRSKVALRANKGSLAPVGSILVLGQGTTLRAAKRTLVARHRRDHQMHGILMLQHVRATRRFVVAKVARKGALAAVNRPLMIDERARLRAAVWALVALEWFMVGVHGANVRLHRVALRRAIVAVGTRVRTQALVDGANVHEQCVFALGAIAALGAVESALIVLLGIFVQQRVLVHGSGVCGERRIA